MRPRRTKKIIGSADLIRNGERTDVFSDVNHGVMENPLGLSWIVFFCMVLGTLFFLHIFGMMIQSDSYFSEGWLNHQPDWLVVWMVYIYTYICIYVCSSLCGSLGHLSKILFVCVTWISPPRFSWCGWVHQMAGWPGCSSHFGFLSPTGLLKSHVGNIRSRTKSLLLNRWPYYSGFTHS